MTFEDFWTLYPRKVDKKRAHAIFERAIKSGVHPDKIVLALKSAIPEWETRKKEHIPHASTWLRGERWNDEIEEPKSQLMAIDCPYLQKLIQVGMPRDKIIGWFVNMKFETIEGVVVMHTQSAFAREFIKNNFEPILNRAFGNWDILLTSHSRGN